ncbi:MAG: hypothetical protein OXH27_12240 [Gammaproteobacteria bacterium]|nr:hypothetical protein [Gammaproteobacteria bacterium]
MNLPFEFESPVVSRRCSRRKLALFAPGQRRRTRRLELAGVSNDGEAKDAINALNSSQMNGRTLRVSEARPRSDRGDRGDRGGDRGDRWRR